jgi:CheY-like chemotaxis protein
MPNSTDTIRPLHVLLIDDDETTRNIFQMVLEHYHFSLDVAVNAQSGIEQLEAGTSPDIIVIDVFLPDQDGYQVFRELRKRGLGAHSKIISTTSYYTTDTAAEAVNRGFDGFLPKPIDSGHLISYLTQIAGENRSA